METFKDIHTTDLSRVFAATLAGSFKMKKSQYLEYTSKYFSTHKKNALIHRQATAELIYGCFMTEFSKNVATITRSNAIKKANIIVAMLEGMRKHKLCTNKVFIGTTYSKRCATFYFGEFTILIPSSDKTLIERVAFVAQVGRLKKAHTEEMMAHTGLINSAWTGMTNLFQAVSTVNSLPKHVDSLTASIHTFNETLKNATDEASTNLEVFRSTITQLSAWIQDNCPTMFTVFEPLCDMLVTSYIAPTSWKGLMIYFVSKIMGKLVGAHVLSTITAALTRYLPDVINHSLPSFEECWQLFTYCFVVITTVAAAFTGKCLQGDDLPYIGVFFERLSTMSANMKTIKNRMEVFETLKTYCKTIFDQVYKIVTGRVYMDIQNHNFAEITEWADIVAALQQRDITALFKNTPLDTIAQKQLDKISGPEGLRGLSGSLKECAARKIERLYFEGLKHLRTIGNKKEYADLKGVVTHHMNWLKSEQGSAVNSFVIQSKSRRAEPVFLVLEGPPGHGKTTCLSFLQQAMFYIMGMRSSQEMSYCMNNEVFYHTNDKYWNGYANQLIYVKDDAGQVLASSSTPDPFYMDVIRMVNSAPFNVPMAELSDKNTNFSSDFMIATTNTSLSATADTGGINAPEAFHRRITWKVRVTAEKDCCDHKNVLDQDKVFAKYGTYRTNKIYRFEFLDSKTGQKLAKIKIGGEQVTLPAKVGFDFVARMLKTQYEHNRSTKDLNDNAEADFIGVLDQIFDNHEAHTETPANVCPFGRHCPIMGCGKKHYAGITTLRDALTILSCNTWLYYKQPNANIINFQYDPDLRDEQREYQTIEDTDEELREWLSLNEHYDLEIYTNEDVMDWSIDQALAFARSDACDYNYFKLSDFKTVEKSSFASFDYASYYLKFYKACTQTKAQIEDYAKSTPWFKYLAVVAGIMTSVALIIGCIKFVPKIARQCYNGACARREKYLARKFNDQENHVSDARKAKKIAKCAERRDQAKMKADDVEKFIVHETAKDSTDIQKNFSGTRQVWEGNEMVEKETIYHNERNAAVAIRNNMYQMYGAESADKGKAMATPVCSLGVFTFLKDCTAITNMHVATAMLSWFKSGRVAILKNHNKQEGYRIDADVVSVVPLSSYYGRGVDLALITFDCHLVNMHRDITRYLQEVRIFSDKSTFSWRFTPDDDAVPMIIPSQVSKHGSMISMNVDGQNLYSTEHFQVTPIGQPGNSGSPIVAVNRLSNQISLIGFYSGCVQGQYGVVQKSEFHAILSALNQIKRTDGLPLISYPLIEGDASNASLDHYRGEFSHVAKATEPKFAPNKTNLVPSFVQGKISELKTRPAHLKTFKHPETGEKINIMVDGIKKFGVANQHINADVVVKCLEAEIQNLATKSYQQKFDKVYSTYESVYGQEGTKFIDAICSSSSCGSVGKRKFIKAYGEQLKVNNGTFKEMQDFEESPGKFVCKIFKEYEVEFENAVRENRRMNLCWEDTPKDEKRPHAKVLQGKTRLFSCCEDVCFLVLFRKYTLGFSASVMNARIENGTCVGVNCYNEDWDKLFEAITAHGENNIFAGDFGGFDGSHNYQVNSRIMGLINKYFYPNATEFENKMRLHLWNEIVQSCHINGSDIYQWFKGQPSGNPMTTLLNCIVNNTGIRMVWDEVWRKEGNEVMRHQLYFNKHVVHQSYGDDSLTAVSEEAIGVFNQISVAENFTKFGFEYTDECKGMNGALVPRKHVSEVNFLKRTFRPDPINGWVMAPIAKDTLYEMMQWVRHGDDDVQQAIENIQNAVREAALHPKDFYDTFRAEIRDVLDEMNMTSRVDLGGDYHGTRYLIRTGQEYKPY